MLRRPLCLLCLSLLLCAVGPSLADTTGPSPELEQPLAQVAGAQRDIGALITTATMIGPVGLNPFIALSAFGLASYLELWQLPRSLALLAHPAMWMSLLCLGLLLTSPCSPCWRW
jgi:hypothetical protein